MSIVNFKPVMFADPSKTGSAYIFVPFEGIGVDLSFYLGGNSPSIGDRPLTNAIGVVFQVSDAQWSFIDGVSNAQHGTIPSFVKVAGNLGTAYQAGIVLVDAHEAANSGGDVKHVLLNGGFSLMGGGGATLAGAEFGAVIGAPFAAASGPAAPIVEGAFALAGGLIGGGIYAYSGLSQVLTDLVLGPSKNVQVEFNLERDLWGSVFNIGTLPTQQKIQDALASLEGLSPSALTVGWSTTGNSIETFSYKGGSVESQTTGGFNSYSKAYFDSENIPIIENIIVTPGSNNNFIKFKLKPDFNIGTVDVVDARLNDEYLNDDMRRSLLVAIKAALPDLNQQEFKNFFDDYSEFKASLEDGIDGARTISGSDADGNSYLLTVDKYGKVRAKALFADTNVTVEKIQGDVTIRESYKDGTREKVDVLIGSTGISYGQIGSIFGSTLGRQLVGNDPFAQVAAGTFFGALGQNLAQIVGFSAIDSYSFNKALDESFSDFGQDLGQAAQGAITSFLVGQLLAEVGLDGIAGEVLNTSAGFVLSTMASNIAEGVNAFKGLEFVNFANVIGSYIGSKLAAEIITFDTLGGQIGAAVGGAIGAYVLGQWGAKFGMIWGPIGAAVGAFVGFIVGGLIGSVFGGAPRSGADVSWDETTKQFTVTNIWSKKGGSKDAAKGIAESVAGTYNNILSAVGGKLIAPDEVQAGNYGMRKTKYVYKPTSTKDSDAITHTFDMDENGAKKLISYGVYEGLSDMIGQIAGGDIYAKRAIAKTISEGNFENSLFSIDTLIGNITSAQDYSRYLANSTAINALIIAEPDSAFAAGWIITIAQANELGLTKRSATDWTGGFSIWLDQLKDGQINGDSLTAAQFSAVFDFIEYAREWQVFDSKNYLLGSIGDTISSADKDIIAGTSGNDTIRVSSDFLDATSSGGINAGITLNGAAYNGTAHKIGIAAVIDGGAGDDVIEGGDLGNDLFGGTGNDILYGGKLDDWIFGGDGNDTLHAGGVDANAKGGDGNYLNGGAGNDILYGREGSDWLEGGVDVDILYGGAGGDILSGGAGDGDELYGGAGSDQYLFRLGDGADIAFDDPGNAGSGDPISARLAAIAAGVVARDWSATNIYSENGAPSGEDSVVFGAGIGLGDIQLQRSPTVGGVDGQDLIVKIKQNNVLTSDQVVLKDWFNSYKKIEWLVFADGQAIRIADFVSFTVGTDGDDVIIGTQGNDFAIGGAGNDLLSLLQGDDVGLGGKGQDAVYGGAGDDLIVGGDDDDKLMGGKGWDVITGDSGDDDIYGGAGNDLVSGGRGNDMIVGGAGNDVFRISRGDGRDTLMDDYTDTWEIVWQNAYVNGFSRNETDNTIGRGADLIFDGTNWIGFFDYDEETHTLRRHVPPSSGIMAADNGTNDVLEFGLGIDIQDLMLTRSGNDLYVGISEENATVSSFASLPDRIRLRDWYAVTPQIEKFVFVATGALDTENTKLGAANAVATDGNDTLTGTGGADWITGNGGDDDIFGGDGNDILNGNAGRDILRGGAGDDVLYGGAGDDLLIGGVGTDTLVGGAGSDTASYEDTGYYRVVVYLNAAQYNVGIFAAGDTYHSIENITGSPTHDKIAGDGADNVLTGGGGDDDVLGGLGDDTYVWNMGNSRDYIRDGAFTIEEVVHSNGQLVDGYTSNWEYLETIVESGVTYYRFRLTVSSSDNVIVYDYDQYKFTSFFQQKPEISSWNTSGWKGGFARSGNDQQVTRDKFDSTINGGEDTVEFGRGISLSELYGYFTGQNLYLWTPFGDLYLVNQTNVNLAIEWLQLDDGLSVSLTNFKSVYWGHTVNGTNGKDDLIFGDASADTLSGLGGNDILSGSGGNDALYGGDGDDHLEGGTGADVLDGGAGNDTIRYVTSASGVTVDLTTQTASGGDATGDTLVSIENVVGSIYGNDVLTGNAGDNRLFGLDGNDTLSGLAGDDVLDGGVGNDLLYGGAGEDSIAGSDGNDQAWGGDDNDIIDGGEGDDILHGDAGDDSLIGGLGADTLYGDDGKDLLVGGDGNDTLSGGAGDDQLVGGAGDDSLSGGAGDDIYLFDAKSGTDTVVDAEGVNSIAFDGSVDYRQIWMTRVNNDLRIGVIGGNATITVQNYYAAGSPSRIKTIATTTHAVYLAYAEPLITQMTGALTTTPTAMPTAVTTELPNYWHAGGKAAPRVSAISITIDEDTASPLQGVGAIDHDGNITGYVLKTEPAHGTVTLNATTGQFSYVPALNYYGSDEFFITVTDADGQSVDAKVTMTIISVNDAPTDIILTAAEAFDGIPENTLTGVTLGTLQALDVDDPLEGDFFGQHSYTVSDARFEVVGDNTLRLRVGESLDYEAAATIDVTVTATDRYGLGLAYVKTFTIAIKDLIDVINGTAFADTLIGAQGVDHIYGLAGNDVLEGRAGDDLLDGGDGADILHGEEGADTLFGGSGDDSLSGGDGNDILWGGAGHDVLAGDSGNDELHGGGESDVLSGGSGNNSLYGDEGDDLFLGGAGADSFNGGAGSDTVSYDASTAAVTVYLDGSSSATGDAANDSLTAIENLHGTAFNDILSGDAGDNRLEGLAGDDTLHGLGGNDVLLGGAGADILYGDAGDDQLDGGDGDDTLYGGADNDTLLGGAGNDTLYAGDGDDIIDGGTGNDTLDGGLGNDTYLMRTSSGADTIWNYDPSGNDIDVIGYQDINYNDLWFERVGDDMVITVIGSATVTTIKNWYVISTSNDRANYKIDFIIAGERYTKTIDSESLVDLMGVHDKPETLTERDTLEQDTSYKSQLETLWTGNQAPVVTAISNQQKDEDQSLTLTVMATDDITPNAGLTVSIVPVNPSDLTQEDWSLVKTVTIGAADSNGDRQVTIQPKDHVHGTVTFRVRAVDAGGIFSSDQIFTLTINAKADMPTITQLAAGTGNAATGVALHIQASFPDQDGSEVQEIVISNLPSGLSLNKGSYNATLDAWVVAANQLSGLMITGPASWYQDLNLSVYARTREQSNNDSAQTTAQSLTVVMNAAPTDLALTASVSEFTSNEVVVGTVGYTDPDGDTNMSFTLLDDAGGRFKMDANGVIRVKNATLIDYETNASHQIQVMITDPAGLTYSETLSINIVDENERPSFSAASYSFANVSEFAAVNTVVGSVSATDPDLATQPTGVKKYYFVHINSSVQAITVDGTYRLSQTTRDGRFQINQETGQITVAGGLSQSDNQSFNYTVVVWDGMANGRLATATINLAVTDINEAPTIGNQTFNIDEGDYAPGPQSGSIATLAFADPDVLTANRNHKFTIVSGNPNNSFRIDDNGKIWADMILDYENLAHRTITLGVQVTDQGGTGLSSSIATVTINLRNVNEAPKPYVSGLPNSPTSTYTLQSMVMGSNINIPAQVDILPGDPDNNGPFVYTVHNQVGGNVSINQNGHLVVYGASTFSVRVTDASGLQGVIYFAVEHSIVPEWPIVFDLDNDGLELISVAASTVTFDMNNDGTPDRTGWVAADDGFLVLDRNGDGIVTDVSEFSFVADVVGARSDLEGLRAFDSNGDNMLDVEDARFGDFHVWRDLNQNGVSDAGELMTLTDAGIAAINLTLTTTGAGLGNIEDNVIYGTADYIRTDATIGTVGDVMLAYVPTPPPAPKEEDITLALPIVFDMDGNGLDIAAISASRTYFDMDGDGDRDRTSWTKGEDGILALDRDGNGKIEGISEISFVKDKEGAKTDLEGLAAFDSNGDGKLSALDDRFGEFRIWQDRNQDGISQAGELRTLAEAEIVDIALSNATPSNGRSDIGNSKIFATTRYTRFNGTQGDVGDIGFEFKADLNAAEPLNFDAKMKKYRLVTQGGELFIRRTNTMGVYDPLAGLIRDGAPLTFKNGTVTYAAPIILDLDGDGVEMKKASKSKARFDMNGDGVADDTGWLGKGDGFLALDRNGDGIINDIGEISFLNDKLGATSDLDGLSAFDSNKNGKLDIGDTRFAEFRVWKDANDNGVTDAGELKSLTDAGIASIGLASHAVNQEWKVGSNIVVGTASFERADGSTGTAGDVMLAYKAASRPPVTTDARLNQLIQAMASFGAEGDGGLSAQRVLLEERAAQLAASSLHQF
ncbi:cadherin domain-containing protein [Govanella unica]|uniref:Cadherin domain-containing protein n=1 Tax=Govanella unica TaxID=2975056 RepID=A0A9X3TXV6_9PROT|nr:cadherin domain-containing protein [Govania unica]MDA5193673.1 cadherin domain-containing protein [Govania unica]